MKESELPFELVEVNRKLDEIGKIERASLKNMATSLLIALLNFSFCYFLFSQPIPAILVGLLFFLMGIAWGYSYVKIKSKKEEIINNMIN